MCSSVWIECCAFPFQILPKECNSIIPNSSNSFILFSKATYKLLGDPWSNGQAVMSRCHEYDCIQDAWSHAADIDLKSRAGQQYKIIKNGDNDEIFSLS